MVLGFFGERRDRGIEVNRRDAGAGPGGQEAGASVSQDEIVGVREGDRQREAGVVKHRECLRWRLNKIRAGEGRVRTERW